MEQRLDGSMARLRDDMQQFMLMFTRQNQVRMAENFPPRDRNEPILHRDDGNRGRANVGVEPDPEEMLEGVVGNDRNGNDRNRNDRNGVHHGQHQGFTMPRKEIPTFEGVNPWWWVRKCERVFE